jgi:DNA recombination protein RmuC
LLGARASKSLPADLLERALSDEALPDEAVTEPGSDGD